MVGTEMAVPHLPPLLTLTIVILLPLAEIDITPPLMATESLHPRDTSAPLLAPTRCDLITDPPLPVSMTKGGLVAAALTIGILGILVIHGPADIGRVIIEVGDIHRRLLVQLPTLPLGTLAILGTAAILETVVILVTVVMLEMPETLARRRRPLQSDLKQLLLQGLFLGVADQETTVLQRIVHPMTTAMKRYGKHNSHTHKRSKRLN
jgi:hypothetical protein